MLHSGSSAFLSTGDGAGLVKFVMIIIVILDDIVDMVIYDQGLKHTCIHAYIRTYVHT